MVMQGIVNFIYDFKNIYIKIIANFICLVSLCALTVWGIIQILNHPLIQCWIGVLSVTIDVYMQYVLAYGKWLWRTKINTNRWRAICINFLSYLIYMLAYNFFFAVGFFMVEFDIKEQATFNTSIVENINQQRIVEINDSIAILNKHLDTESQSGYGTKSQKITSDKEKLIKERENLMQTFNKTSLKEKIVYTNVFNAWAEALDCSTNWLKIISFGVLVMTIQIILIWTSWDIDPIAKKEKTNSNVNLSGDKKELLVALDGFFDGKNGNGLTKEIPLNGVDVVSKKTGFSKDRCIMWRNHLNRLKVNGDTAFRITKGVTYSNYPKEFIRNYILSH
jgi:hypothetical protein